MKINKRLKTLYIVITSIFVFLFNLPFALAKSGAKLFFHSDPLTKASTGAVAGPKPAKSVYDSLHLNLSGLSQKAFAYARTGWEKLKAEGKLMNDSVLSIVDFSQPSSQKRLYVLDLKNYKVLFNTLVAHGKNSGEKWANSFSNKASSLKSSPGFYVTGDTYNGDNGYSMRLEGVEKGINDNAYERAIVMHGADYVSPAVIASKGYIGRSWGCPAVPRDEVKPIVNTIKDGSCLFIYNPSYSYISHSSVLNS